MNILHTVIITRKRCYNTGSVASCTPPP